ncbi:MAG: hypothetical protein ACREO5_10175, partial [Candidatus Binatia bacterium]
CLTAALVACSSVPEQSAAPVKNAVQEQAKAPAPSAAPAAAQKAAQEPVKGESKAAKAQTKQSKSKAAEVEGVISSVGQRTITFQVERKGKVREEVVGVDDKTDIEKAGNKVKLRDLQETDKALINYEPDAYTPATAIKVTGQGKIQKVGGDD